MRLWPRLDRQAAQAIFSLISEAHSDVGGLARRATTTVPDLCSFASTGGTRASDQDLAELRATIVEAATAHGYPSRSEDAIAFDRALAPRLHTAMPMAVGEALNRDVWSFTSLVLAPDVTMWRFGSSNRERWICSDRTRHMFGRLWWQSYLLGDADGGSTLDALSESDLNQLLERTSLGGCRPLVRQLARRLTTLPEASGSPRRTVVREASLRALRLMAVIDPHVLTEDALAALVDEVVADAIAAAEAELAMNPYAEPPV